MRRDGVLDPTRVDDAPAVPHAAVQERLTELQEIARPHEAHQFARIRIDILPPINAEPQFGETRSGIFDRDLTPLAGLILVFATPYVLVPLFFKMQPLADAETVERIHTLVNRAGTPVRDVCSLNFSRRTAEANAAVIGLGRSRRVVIADTLLAEFAPSV